MQKWLLYVQVVFFFLLHSTSQTILIFSVVIMCARNGFVVYEAAKP